MPVETPNMNSDKVAHWDDLLFDMMADVFENIIMIYFPSQYDRTVQFWNLTTSQCIFGYSGKGAGVEPATLFVVIVKRATVHSIPRSLQLVFLRFEFIVFPSTRQDATKLTKPILLCYLTIT